MSTHTITHIYMQTFSMGHFFLFELLKTLDVAWVLILLANRNPATSIHPGTGNLNMSPQAVKKP